MSWCHVVFTSLSFSVYVDISNGTTHTCTLHHSIVIRFATALVQARNNSANYTPVYT